MFTQNDFQEYLMNTERQLSQILLVYTDMLNEIDEKAMRSKITSIMTESLEAYRFIKKKRGELFLERKTS